MIDIETEEIISLAEAAAMIPCGRKERTPDVKTVYAWTKHGLRGQTLESVQMAGRRCTSKQAVRRFIEALTSAADLVPAVTRRVDAKRDAVVTAALQQLGVAMVDVSAVGRGPK